MALSTKLLPLEWDPQSPSWSSTRILAVSLGVTHRRYGPEKDLQNIFPLEMQYLAASGIRLGISPTALVAEARYLVVVTLKHGFGIKSLLALFLRFHILFLVYFRVLIAWRAVSQKSGTSGKLGFSYFPKIYEILTVRISDPTTISNVCYLLRSWASQTSHMYLNFTVMLVS